MKNKYEILFETGLTLNIPIFLDSTYDDLGVLSEFDGDISQIQQISNFTFNVTGNTVTIYNTSNSTDYKFLLDANFIIDWGDDNTSSISINLPYSENLSTASHTYASSGTSVVSLTLNSPWGSSVIKKNIKHPSDTTVINPYGTMTYDIPYLTGMTETQNYINDWDSTSGYTGTISFAAIGDSRINEIIKYGSNKFNPSTMTTGITEGVLFTGYTIDNLNYKDYSEGYTIITGNIPTHGVYTTTGITMGNTTDFTTEYITNNLLIRNEHFLGFIDEPLVYSDVFVERGKESVMEKNLRLRDIDNLGELEIYGNGFFIVKKI